MCVNGSLIRSSTWRSSSVSAPCISSSICLPSSPERSRTMRGSFCQALPIGCIRVFMTPSCSSAVTLDSRCSGTLNSVSSLRREISRSWLRVRTSSETMVIRCSSVSTLTRIDWLAILSASWTSVSADSGALGRLCLGGFLGFRRRPASAAGAGCLATGAGAGLGAGAASVSVSRKARSRSSSETSPGRSGRSSTWSTSVPLATSWIAGCTGGAATTGTGAAAGSAAACLAPSAIACSFSIRSSSVPSGSVSVASRPARISLMRSMRGQDQRHGFGLDRHAVAEFAHQRLAGMGQRFQPRQAEEAAGALDGVDQAEDVIQDLRVARVLLEPHQLIVDRIQALAGLGQKLPQQIIHETGLRTHRHATSTCLTERGQLLCKAFNIG